MGRLIDDLLLLSVSDAGQWSIKKEMVELDTAILEAAEEMEEAAREHEMHIQVNLPEEEVSAVSGDGERIRQLLLILISNAVSYSGGKRISLSLYETKHQVCIKVEDDGVGIGKEEENRIFDRFYRADKSRKDKNHFGLGLSIAKEIMNLHGGMIELIKAEKGCTFLMHFPKKGWKSVSKREG
ncbi:MAG: HAMP domain-containing histidine kinase [Lachnospiraceae bacterium]|nr:HAMP domain-containing histidine kinase [Lachnospiraceae bacterium]